MDENWLPEATQARNRGLAALFPPIPQPEITGNPAVVLVHLGVAVPPVVELTGGDVEPPDEPTGADLGLLRPAPDEIHDQKTRPRSAGHVQRKGRFAMSILTILIPLTARPHRYLTNSTRSEERR